MPMPAKTPTAPPAVASRAACSRKNARTWPRRAPRARRRAISAGLSLTEIHIIVRMPMAPTPRGGPPVAPPPPLMAIRQDAADVRHHQVAGGGASEGHVDLDQIVAVEQAHRLRHRDERGVVQIEVGELALRPHHTD